MFAPLDFALKEFTKNFAFGQIRRFGIVSPKGKKLCQIEQLNKVQRCGIIFEINFSKIREGVSRDEADQSTD